jgi:hypothetical protein
MAFWCDAWTWLDKLYEKKGNVGEGVAEGCNAEIVGEMI